MAGLIIKHEDEKYINPELYAALDTMARDYNKTIVGTSCYRSEEKQKTINADVLRSNQGAWQNKDGSVYIKVLDNKGKFVKNRCLAAAYGQSNHNTGFAVDTGNSDGDNEWAKSLNSSVYNKYGLHKPADGENWHWELIKTSNMTRTQKENAFPGFVKYWDYQTSCKKWCDKFGLDFNYWRNKMDIDKYFAAAVAKMAR